MQKGSKVALMLDSIARSSGPPVNLSELILLLTSNIVCRVTFGKKQDGGEDKSRSRFHEILHETQDLLGGFCIADFFPWMGWLSKFNGLETRLEKNFGELDEFIDKVIEEHLDPKGLNRSMKILLMYCLEFRRIQTSLLLLVMTKSRVFSRYDPFAL